MKQENIRQLKAKAQRLETLIERFEEDVGLLYENKVNIEENEQVAERQAKLQNEIEQVTSDLLLLLDMSGEIETADGRSVELPQNGRRPIADGNLPEPSHGRPKGRGPPAWAGGNNGNPGNGGNNGNPGNGGNNGNPGNGGGN